VSRETVYRYRRVEEPPEPVRFRHKKRVLDLTPFSVPGAMRV